MDPSKHEEVHQLMALVSWLSLQLPSLPVVRLDNGENEV